MSYPRGHKVFNHIYHFSLVWDNSLISANAVVYQNYSKCLGKYLKTLFRRVFQNAYILGVWSEFLFSSFCLISPSFWSLYVPTLKAMLWLWLVEMDLFCHREIVARFSISKHLFFFTLWKTIYASYNSNDENMLVILIECDVCSRISPLVILLFFLDVNTFSVY